MQIGIRINDSDLQRVFKNYPVELEKELTKSISRFGRIYANNLRRVAMSDQFKSPARGKAIQQISSRKQSKNVVEITIPKSLDLLDSMKAHFISLKRGRKITKWASKYYNGMRVPPDRSPKFRSKVIRGKYGGIRGGWLYVQPRPFIDQATRMTLPRLDGLIERSVKITEIRSKGR